MSVALLTMLLALAGLLMLLERAGARTTLQLTFKGDLKRETLWLSQYGQSVCTPLAALLVWQFEPDEPDKALGVFFGVCAASLSAFLIKRLTGRVRPNREQAGRFLGPTLRHANWRESFPSSHSACAVALSALLAHLYPQAAVTFWVLGVLTALLRYVLDAHWPSDVVAGVALGYAVAHGTIHVAGW